MGFQTSSDLASTAGNAVSARGIPSASPKDCQKAMIAYGVQQTRKQPENEAHEKTFFV